MTDDLLKITLGDMQLRHPIICSSGEHVMTIGAIRAALDVGVAGVVAKSINESPLAASQLRRAAYMLLNSNGTTASSGDAELSSSVFCRSGLAAHAPEEWFQALARLDRDAAATSQFVAASIVLGDASAAADLATLAQHHGLRILELNVGAPHGPEAARGAITLETDATKLERVVRAVRERFAGQLWVKLSGLSERTVDLAQASRAAGANAVGLIGRFLGMMPDVETLKPMLGTSAAYGGQWALPITCRALAQTRRALGPSLPLIGTNGARTGLDVARLILAGATAVEMASVVYLGGFGALERARLELLGWLERKRCSVTDVIGLAADSVQSYAEQPEFPDAWKDFVPPEAR